MDQENTLNLVKEIKRKVTKITFFYPKVVFWKMNNNMKDINKEKKEMMRKKEELLIEIVQILIKTKWNKVVQNNK